MSNLIIIEINLVISSTNGFIKDSYSFY